MFAALVLAVSISSTSITNFMSVPPWIPTSVASEYTFGSADREDASHRVTSNTFAAVASIYDAYYERVYFKSACGVRDTAWRVADYGPRDFRTMSFTNGVLSGRHVMIYRSGDRTLPDTHRLVEWPWLLQFQRVDNDTISDLFDCTGRMIYRDNWCDTGNRAYDSVNYWSTSLLGGQRLPSEYGWTSYAPSESLFTACPTIFACDVDSYFHCDSSTRADHAKYVVPKMFAAADANYYSSVISPLVPQDVELTNTVASLIDGAFGGNSVGGIASRSRRLLPDDYDDANSNRQSSLVATVSRALSILDRTYEFPKVADGVYLTNVTISAEKSLTLKYQKLVTPTTLSMIPGESTGTFTCETVSDHNLGPSVTEIGTNTTTTFSDFADATRDRGHFAGTSTSVEQSGPHADGYYYYISVGEFLDPAPPEYLGTNNVTVSIYGSENHNAFIYLNSLGSPICSTLHPLQNIGFMLSVDVIVSRSAESSFSLPVSSSDVELLLPTPVPCGSAFDSGRVAYAYGSFLGFFCKWVYGEKTWRTLADGCTYVDLTRNPDIVSQTAGTSLTGSVIGNKNALRYAYLNARTATRQKMIAEMNGSVAGWMNPVSLCSVDAGFVDSSAAGSYLSVSGGSFNLKMDFGNGDNRLYAVVEDGHPECGGYKVTKIGWMEGTEWHWLGENDYVKIVYTFSPTDDGSGFRLSDSVTDANSVTCNALAVPVVTTDWNWKSLKMGE